MEAMLREHYRTEGKDLNERIRAARRRLPPGASEAALHRPRKLAKAILQLDREKDEGLIRINIENHYPDLEFLEILREPYSGRAFPGFEDIDLSFEELESLFRSDRPDWKAALESVNGVYLITDIATVKRYVGSAYGDQGIWSRWCSYIASGHGGNLKLRALVADPSLDHCRKSFRFALLEYRPSRTPDEIIIGRESFWKRILLTRGERGLNRN